VRFSDRSELGVGPGTRFRVSGLELHGAHVMLEGGTLHARIHRDPHTAWSLDAGPYVVHVTGTEFDLAWRAEDQTLDLRLREGSVVVEGPLADAGVRVRAGQHLVANGNTGTLSLVDEQNGRSAASDAVQPRSAPAPTGNPAPSLAAAPVDAQYGSRPRETAAASRGHGSETQSWPARVGHGDFDGVIADAERRGIDRSIADSTVTDLAALADAARYARREDLARRALTAQRARYPGSMQARDASFFLGGLAESQKNDVASLQWYDVYLGENTDGAYASQALGRKMMLVQRMRGLDGARAIAIEYLARFPDGPYASSANKLLHAQ
jgi:TolA-binding protein